ncbi:tyrosine-type recombinase/integrase [Paenibacillus athensensis]|uniref:Integrase n=1 Tax=Paenibacillus athensensis TaxID=1967502 RepID=A0A4Y8PYR5_9BACL|nr:tyrosine-type recombinase/integrase [Paenibacillus athensensis]MCD1261260.1 tyrosine-type recombinase/integrase [Paenibacillus athensensis]
MRNVVAFPNEHMATRRRKNIIDMDSSSSSGSDIKLSWDEAVEIYLRAKRSETASERTVCHEQENLASYKRILLEQDLEPSVEKITVEAVRKHFVMYMVEQKGYALSTINNRIKSLKRFFSFLHREGWILNNPLLLLKARKGQQNPICSFTEEQIGSLLAQPNQHTFTGLRDYAMLTLILDTGLRLGELVKLQLNQVELKGCFLQGVLGKSRRPRDVPFCDDLRKIMTKYIKIRGDLPSNYLFVTIDGNPMKERSIQEIISEYGKKARIEGVRVSPHTFRHTFAKLYIMNGGDPYSLQEILGHTTQDMVKRYVNLWKPEKKLQHAKASPMKNLIRGGTRKG